jgi:hypothetical protein
VKSKISLRAVGIAVVAFAAVREIAKGSSAAARSTAVSSQPQQAQGSPAQPEVGFRVAIALSVACTIAGIGTTNLLLHYGFLDLSRLAGRRDLVDTVLFLLVGAATFAVPALCVYGATKSSRQYRLETIGGLGLVAVALLLIGSSTRVPPDPTGSLFNVFVLAKRTTHAPRLELHFYDDAFYLSCVDCTVKNPALIGFAVAPPGPAIKYVGPYSKDSAPWIKSYAPVAGRIRGTDVTVPVRTRFYAFTHQATLGVSTAGSFISTGTTTAIVSGPTISLPVGTITHDAKAATTKNWVSPKRLDVREFVGSARGPMGNGDAAFVIARSDPQPSSVDEFFINWKSNSKDPILGPSAVLTSPARESAATQHTLLAGALAGAGVLGLLRAFVAGALALYGVVRVMPLGSKLYIAFSVLVSVVAGFYLGN